MRIVAICMHAHAMHALRNMHAPLSFLIKGLLCRAWPFQSTGYENMFLRGYLLGMSTSSIRSKVDDIAEFTELGDFLNLPLKTYSSGMLGRLACAVQVCIEPEILIDPFPRPPRPRPAP